MTIARRTALGLLGFAAGLRVVPAWAQRSLTGYYRLMHGPMLGAPGPDQIELWMRTSSAVSVVVEYATDPGLRDSRRTAPAAASAATDFVARVRLTGLQPDTTYYYRLWLSGLPDRYLKEQEPFAFRTAAPIGAKGRYRVAFGSCARIQLYPEQLIWDAVDDWRPDLFLWRGDNVYHDTLEPQIMDEMYRWQRKVPNLERLQRRVPQLAIWDDHDYALNDSDRNNPAKKLAMESFKRYWANPAYGLPDVPGVFFRHAHGNVDLFMLDGRWYRDPIEQPDGPQKTLLGRRQLTWLKDELKASRATFKLLVSGSGWSTAKGPAGDAWSAYLHERDELFEFIRREGIEGVVLLSGDTHVGELNAIPWSERGGYDLYELVSSPLAQDTRTTWLDRRPEMRMREVFVGSQNFGAVEIDTTADDPTVSLNVIDARGNRAWTPLVIKASELRNGVRSWERKIDSVSRSRLESMRQGKDYYTPDPARAN
jgi:alkaline phosphatase D